jgi:AbiU2
MNEQTAAEAKQEHIAKMGVPLGTQYAELWQEIADLHLTWLEYVELFGEKKSRIDLLNSAALRFFRMIEDRLKEAVFLHIARLTDLPFIGSKSNLTLLNLPGLIEDLKLKDEVEKRCGTAVAGATFARDWRNRHIAHRDLDLALGENAKPLPEVQVREVSEALSSFEAVLNAIAGHFLKSETSFGHAIRRGGTIDLLYVIDDGLTAQKERHARIAAGDHSEADFRVRDL